MAGKNMFSDVKSAVKGLKADLIELKHDAQICIMNASMRKTMLGDSEAAVKDDIKSIRKQLERLVQKLEMRAQLILTQTVQKERDSINSDVLFLEDMYKRAEETEEAVTAKTSNISLKALKEGRDSCDTSIDSLSEFKQRQGSGKCARFILHPVLTYILEQMEQFSMGDVIVTSVPDETITFDEKDDIITTEDSQNDTSDNRKQPSASPRKDPLNTSFMRSDTMKSIKVRSSEGEKKPRNISRQNSKISKPVVQRQNSEKVKSAALSRQNSQVIPRQTSGSERKPSIAKPLSITKANSEIDPKARSNRKDETKPAKQVPDDDLRYISGLKATLAKRSATAPLLNLMSKERSTFVSMEKDIPKIKTSLPSLKYRETLITKKHNTSCYITGIAVMANGSVIVADTVHDSLQMFDPNFQRISELECPHPWGLTPVSEGAIAVTLHYDHKLILVKADKLLERINEKEIVVKCKAGLLYDVTYHEYRLYVLCMESEVHVMDLKGRQYKVVQTGIAQNSLKFLAVDKENLQIVVSGEAGVACVNFEGLPLWHYKTRSKAKFLAMGVLIQNGRIFVCDWENHCIVEIYADGADRRTVFSENIERPVAIAASDDGGTVFVAQGDYDMAKEKSLSVKVVTVNSIQSL